MKYFVLALTIALLVNFINCDEDDEKDTEKLNVKYKGNLTLDCNKFEKVDYYQVLKNGTHIKLDENKNELTLQSLRREQLESKYMCKQEDKVVREFVLQIAPFIKVPDKTSQTVTEKGRVELKCFLLYGNENTSVTWEWLRNETIIENNDKFVLSHNNDNTSLIINDVLDSDKGDYTCKLKNEYGEHVQTLQLRVKDRWAALWPFLAIVAEVFILCLIILIYEKKCSKKQSANEEDNEQTQPLNQGNSDVKKRSGK